MDYKQVFTDFTIEVPCDALPDCWRELPRQMLKDPDATPREKMLALHFLKMAETLDKIVSDLNFGLASVRVLESDVHIVPDE